MPAYPRRRDADGRTRRIVNIGAVTTVKTVIKTAVPSTCVAVQLFRWSLALTYPLARSVFVPVVVDGVTQTATSVVKVVEEITSTMVRLPRNRAKIATADIARFCSQTQTAVATKVIQTTVVSGKVSNLPPTGLVRFVEHLLCRLFQSPSRPPRSTSSSRQSPPFFRVPQRSTSSLSSSRRSRASRCGRLSRSPRLSELSRI